MPLGPGKYGANAARLLWQHGGTLCAVILVGNKGPGFDVATIDPALLVNLPGILREVADSLDEDLRSKGAIH